MRWPGLCRDGPSGRGRIGIGGRRGLLDIAFALLRSGQQFGIFRTMLAEQALSGMRLRHLIEGIGQLAFLGLGRARIRHANLLPVA
jgi:hypothetical protein